MLKFEDINAFEKGQRESFERLVCLLAKREKPPGGKIFRNFDGSGGDGGVEALWILEDGGKIGYQAKFFTGRMSVGNRWKQLDDSVKQALRVYPDLRKYIVALPLDFTGSRGGSKKSESGKWDEKVKEWEGEARNSEMEVSFEIWDKIVLEDMLYKKENSSLREHWFGDDVLDNSWFKMHIQKTHLFLDDRFNPDKHVEISIEDLFDTIVRGPKTIDDKRNAFADLEKSTIPSNKFTTLDHAPNFDALMNSIKIREEIIEIKESLTSDFSVTWDFHILENKLCNLHEITRNLIRDYEMLILKSGREEKNQIEEVMNGIEALKLSCMSAKRFLRRKSLCAERSKCAIVYGPGGVGKSHILGRISQQRIQQELPTVMLLGEKISGSVIWKAIGENLDFKCHSEKYILDNLNGAGLRLNEKVLILFDAINESENSQIWKRHIPEVINAIKGYSNLAVVFTCRDENLQSMLAKSLSNELPLFELGGFLSDTEFNQAISQYFSEKGIDVPDATWLSHEFRNPLFLKITSEALLAKNCTKFPHGPQGFTTVIELYLDGLANRIDPNRHGAEAIATAVKKFIYLAAKKMVSNGCDFIKESEASGIISQCFDGVTPPLQSTWLDALVEVGLFRRGYAPLNKESDSVSSSQSIFRITFQKIQDHLMAVCLVKEVDKLNLSENFYPGGPLNFLFYDGCPEKGFDIKYSGLVGSLSLIYPEILGDEFAKTVPNWNQHWNNCWILQKGFFESFIWRNVKAFQKDSEQLLVRLDPSHSNPLNLLLDVSAIEEHPFNALYLNSRLKSKSIAVRDSIWTNWINLKYMDDYNVVDRIISWGLSNRESTTGTKKLKLVAIVLTWLLSSSHMTLRDRATKALTSIFIENHEIFIFALEKINGCDDPYIFQRIYAAAFGACCIDPSTERLSSYSRNVYDRVFSLGRPPAASLLRDYALGIIEIANSKDALDIDIPLSKCYHPFKSEPPILELTESTVREIAEDRDGLEVFLSSGSDMNDFGGTEILASLRIFLSSRIVQPRPVSREFIKKKFYEEVISPYPDRVSALEEAEMAHFFKDSEPRNKTAARVSRRKIPSMKISYTTSVERIRSMLNPTEKKRMEVEYLNIDRNLAEFDEINIQQCRLWIVKRAFELGWTKKLFPGDEHIRDFGEFGLERIGKKYERIALDEIHSRLADNFWIIDDTSSIPYFYKYGHLNLHRDIDPTILPEDTRLSEYKLTSGSWESPAKIRLPAVQELSVIGWTPDSEIDRSVELRLVREDEFSRKWIVIHEKFSRTQMYAESQMSIHGLHSRELQWTFCIFVPSGTAKEIAEFLKLENLDSHSLFPRESAGNPYLMELYWRDACANKKKFEKIWRAPDNFRFTVPVFEYQWEGQSDKSLPMGFHMMLPQKWWINEIGASVSMKHPYNWEDKSGNIVIQSRKICDSGSVILVDGEIMINYSKAFDFEPLWVFYTDRRTWKDDGGLGEWGRWNCIAWSENEWKSIAWKNCG